MKIHHRTYYQCEECETEYLREEDARKCEASTPPCDFKVGQMVYLKEGGSGFTKHSGNAVEIREINLICSRYSAQHSWELVLGLADEYGGRVTRSPMWLEAVPPAPSAVPCPDCERALWTKESAEGRYSHAAVAAHSFCLSKAEDVYPKGAVECRDRVIEKLRSTGA